MQITGTGEERLWAAHVPALGAFLAAQTQWRTRLVATEHGLRGIVLGFDYAGVKVALEILDISLRPHEWRDFAALEREAATLLNGAAP